MKYDTCGQETSVHTRELEMIKSVRETMKSHCRNFYNRERWKQKGKGFGSYAKILRLTNSLISQSLSDAIHANEDRRMDTKRLVRRLSRIASQSITIGEGNEKQIPEEVWTN